MIASSCGALYRVLQSGRHCYQLSTELHLRCIENKAGENKEAFKDNKYLTNFITSKRLIRAGSSSTFKTKFDMINVFKLQFKYLGVWEHKGKLNHLGGEEEN